ncbi:MAG TPA: DNA repair protein RecO [Bacteroidales bacterium]|nr:DNA repair protein RecO [Bacteroidales bacterium]HPT02454.1 DNA repair protein RecO [Bacteroidales bacterium]
MLIVTKGIVLHTVDYSETSVIVKVFTEQFGMQSYLVKGVRKARSKIKRNLFGPLSLVEIVAYRKENTGLSVARDVTCHVQLNHIASDIRKMAVAVFINELVYRSIQGEMPDQQLYNFLYRTVLDLDSADISVAGFHLVFAMQLAHHLGFGPHDNYTPANNFFDLQEAYFRDHPPDHPYYLAEPLSRFWHELIGFPDGRALPQDFTYSVRKALLDRLMDYFRLHVPAFGEMKSHHVLNEVFRD